MKGDIREGESMSVRLLSRRAFSLIEMLIVIMILAILAMIVVPRYTMATDNARQASLADQLRMFREQINVFRAQHNELWPGLEPAGTVGTDEMFRKQITTYTSVTGVPASTKDATYRYGPYLRALPPNPISNLSTVWIYEATNTPTPNDSTGWIYQPLTGRLYANSTQSDVNGKAFFDY
jgi:general secretion pathway protein G